MEELGGGGFGVVFLCEDPDNPKIQRAIKVPLLIHNEETNAWIREAFGREARKLRQIEHLHVARFYDFNEDPPYLVMEHVSGDSLAKRIGERGALNTQEVLDLAKQLGDALNTISRASLIHRDIKPANIILQQKTAKLLDFGLALDPEGTRFEKTQTNAVGSYPYSPIEQCKGQTPEPSWDVYSLGVTLYEALTGERCFRPESGLKGLPRLGRIIALKEETPRLDPGVIYSSALRELLARMTDNDPANRPSALDVARIAQEHSEGIEWPEGLWITPAPGPEPEDAVPSETPLEVDVTTIPGGPPRPEDAVDVPPPEPSPHPPPPDVVDPIPPMPAPGPPTSEALVGLGALLASVVIGALVLWEREVSVRLSGLEAGTPVEVEIEGLGRFAGEAAIPIPLGTIEATAFDYRAQVGWACGTEVAAEFGYPASCCSFEEGSLDIERGLGGLEVEILLPPPPDCPLASQGYRMVRVDELDLFVGATEVTVGLWDEVMGDEEPASELEGYHRRREGANGNGACNQHGDPSLPVVCVDFEAATRFTARLAEREGRAGAYGEDRSPVEGADGYRLLTVAERGLLTAQIERDADWPCGDANLSLEGCGGPGALGPAGRHAAGTVAPWSAIYDLVGNAWEWTWRAPGLDTKQHISGASWYQDRWLDAFYAAPKPPDYADDTTGFRIVRAISN